MEKHVCSHMVRNAARNGVGFHHCRINATVQVPPTNNWYCLVHASQIMNKAGSPENKAITDRINNPHAPSQCRLEKCDFNRIQPSENSQECIGCSGLKDPNYTVDHSKWQNGGIKR